MNELFKYLIVRKKYWLIPVVVVLFLIGFLIVFASSSALSPFIYTLSNEFQIKTVSNFIDNSFWYFFTELFCKKRISFVHISANIWTINFLFKVV